MIIKTTLDNIKNAQIEIGLLLRKIMPKYVLDMPKNNIKYLILFSKVKLE